MGEKWGGWAEQEKSFSTQTRVLGHATPPQCLAMQDAEMETVAPRDHGALHQHKGVLWAPPEAPAGSGAEEVCVHVHVREHGQFTDSTGCGAQGRRETEALGL